MNDKELDERLKKADAELLEHVRQNVDLEAGLDDVLRRVSAQRELDGLLGLLEDVDQRQTPEHIAERYAQLRQNLTDGEEALASDEPLAIIEDLIERSSLGTPAAKAIRARTPPEVVEDVLRRPLGRADEDDTKG